MSQRHWSALAARTRLVVGVDLLGFLYFFGSERAVPESSFGSLNGDVNDGLAVLQLTIVDSGNIHEILKPLVEVLMVRHLSLPEVVEIGRRLVEGQMKELLIFESESNYLLDETDKRDGFLFLLAYGAPVSLLFEFALKQISALSNDYSE